MTGRKICFYGREGREGPCKRRGVRRKDWRYTRTYRHTDIHSVAYTALCVDRTALRHRQKSSSFAPDLFWVSFQLQNGNVKRTASGLTISRAQGRSARLQSRTRRASNETNGVCDNHRPVGIVAALGPGEEVIELYSIS